MSFEFREKRSHTALHLLLIAVAAMVMALGLAVSTHAMEATVKVPIKSTGYEAQLTKSYTYTQANKLGSGEVGCIVPLTVSAPGTIQVNINVQNLQRAMDLALYTDAACTNRVSGLYAYLEMGETSDGGYVSVSGAGTYYLKMSSSHYSSSGNFTNTVSVGLGEYTKADKTITGKIRYYRIGSKDIHRFKYKATKTGKVYFSLSTPYGYYVRLENAKKKPLCSDFCYVSSGVDDHKGKIGFAVKKGQTYYFAVKSIGSGELQTATVSGAKAIKEKSGAKKKKAVLLKAKKKANGTILPAEKRVDWYKIKVPKKKKVTFTLTGETNVGQNYKDGLLLTVYNSKGKKIDSLKFRGPKAVAELTYGRTYGKANKGTYYIKISPINKKSSGFYTLKWK